MTLVPQVGRGGTDFPEVEFRSGCMMVVVVPVPVITEVDLVYLKQLQMRCHGLSLVENGQAGLFLC